MVPWRRSVVSRYVAISVIVAIIPLGVVGALYDRFASDLVHSLTGEKLERRLTVIASRLRAFLDARAYQLETLAGYPALVSLLAPRSGRPIEASLKAVVQFEADQPDLYGILLFSSDGALIRAFPGQAASGAPYWGGRFSLDDVPRVAVGGSEILGPMPPGSNTPGSFLIMRNLSSGLPGTPPAGKIALHVRLASLTELLGADDETGLVHPILFAPDGKTYANVGVPISPSGRLIKGAEIAPGWRAALIVEWDALAAPLERVRYVMIAVIVLLVVVLPWLLIALGRNAVRRVSSLVAGAEQVASGNLSWRIHSKGRDEIATLAESFNSMAARLQQVLRSTVEVEKMAVLGRFATGIAHEVRNPLATMKTSVQALRMHEKDPERQSILDGLGEEIDRLDDTVDDLLTYARPREPHFEAVPVRELFRRVTAMVDKPAREAGISLSCSGMSDIWVHVDRTHIQQILMNLVLNSLEAMPKGGLLTLRAASENGRATIEVADTGEGIGPEALAKITDPFFTTRPNGTGLGLAISRQLAELNKGELRFTSAPGQGTTATLSLRLAPKEA